jgi:hypothetical protein
MFFATLALPFLRTVACFALLNQVVAPAMWTFNHCRIYHDYFFGHKDNYLF